MDSFIDRLADLLKGLMGDREEEPGSDSDRRNAHRPGSGAGWRDPDLRAAWEELEDYLGNGPGSGGTGRRAGASPGSAGAGPRRPEPPVDESLRKDFANLEVPFGADIETVRKSYKALMLRYHPDKFANDPEKQRVALEITKKINESFDRIRSRKG